MTRDKCTLKQLGVNPIKKSCLKLVLNSLTVHYLKMDQTSNFSIVEIQTELISHQLVNQFKTNLFIFGTNFLKYDYLLDNKNDRTRFVNVR